MTLVEFLNHLRGLAVKLWADDGQLRYSAPKGALTPELRAELIARKQEILAFLSQAAAETQATAARLQPVARDRALPLSFAQQRLWFLDQLAPGSSFYNIPTAIRLNGALQFAALRRSLQAIVQRHESLRTMFAERDGQPVQVIVLALDIGLPLIDLQRCAPARQETEIARLAIEAASVAFELDQGPLLRAWVLRLAPTDHILFLTLHHIIADGWSIGVLVKELTLLYSAFAGGQPAALPALPIQYGDYAYWQRQWLQDATLQAELGYWRAQLRGVSIGLELPADRPRPAVQTFRGASRSLIVPAATTEALKALGRQEDVTLFMTLLAAFAIVLYRYTGHDDIVLGTPIAGRHHPETQGLIGCFVNTLVLRIDLSGNAEIRQVLRQARAVALGAYAHQNVPFEKLVEELALVRDLSRNPLFQIMLALQSAPLENTKLADLTLDPLSVESTTAALDITFNICEIGPELLGTLIYNTDLFDAATIEHLLELFQTLLSQVARDPAQRVDDVPILSAAETYRLLTAWNDTSVSMADQLLVHQAFSAQAGRTPDGIAAIFVGTDPGRAGTEQISYAELDRRSDQLARYLRALGVGPEVRVALCVDRRLDMVVGLLGILKAGGAYVPLDPAYPAERLAFMLEDAQVSVLLTSKAIGDLRPALSVVEGLEIGRQRQSQISNLQSLSVVAIDADWELIAQARNAMPIEPVDAEHIAYVIYTSGSTGRPKGVQISHRALMNFLVDMGTRLRLGMQDVLLAVTTLSFDIAALEIFLPLISGARLALAGQELVADSAHLLAALAGLRATAMQATPTTWRMLIEAGWSADQPIQALCGGEALPPALAEQLLARAPVVWNLYGPTETTIWSTVYQLKAGEAGVSIGRPIANTQIYILDRALRPVPAGVPGELYIGGAGLARGYLARPELTAERFVPNPFLKDEGLRMKDEASDFILHPSSFRLYKTGDLARWHADGNLEFFGRADQQVKIHGHRIEPGEIEAVLLQHADVRQALVVAQGTGQGHQRLVAYLVPSQEQRTKNKEQRTENREPRTEPDDKVTRRQGDKVTAQSEHTDSSPSPLHPFTPSAQELRTYLKSRLPDYMHPAAFVFLDTMPLTPNGKVDRKALPAPEQTRPTLEVGYSAPRSQLEALIAAVWQQALGVEHVGVHDNFFDLGGNSILMTQVRNRLQEALSTTITMVDLFRYPTIDELASFLGREAPAPAHAPIDRPGEPAAQPVADIAIVGMAGRFPGAPNIETFWQNLCDGVESIRSLSDDLLLEAGADPQALRNPMYVKRGAPLDDMELFDAAFFDIGPRDAEVTDPQHRLFLECAWEALEHAGCDPARYPGMIGLYAGVGLNSYLLSNLYARDDLVESVGSYQIMLGNDKDYLPTRVSYKLNLTGPSVTVQTACSSSLVAVHLACQALQRGECDMALAGGVSINVSHQRGYLYQPGGIASPDGHCRAFDSDAQGTVFGSGLGLVVLKPLSQALRDHDTIYAVIKGSAINNDGAAKAGYTAPSVSGQATVIERALRSAQVAPETIGLIEAHGTGTPLGDPIEVAALAQVFRPSASPCALGTVKANIGHLDAAAGIAGLIKAALALYHGCVPPTLHIRQPHPDLQLAATPFYLPTALTAWPEPPAHPRRAGVSSFGIGGTNAHVILEAPPAATPAATTRDWNVLLVSAKTSPALERVTDNLAAHLRRFPDLAMDDVAYTLQVGRSALQHRRALVYRGRAEALELLDSRDPARVLTAAADGRRRTIAFLFPGQGAQHVQMGRDLYQHEPLFRETVDRCAELLRPHLGLDIRDVIYPDHRPPTTDHRPPTAEGERGRRGEGENGQSLISNLQSPIDETQYAQPALFVIEYALARLWMAWGVRPQAMIGHSLGEYVAACLTGVFSLEDALELVAVRGRLMQEMPGGAMLSVLLPEAELQQALAAARRAGIGPLDLAAVNGPAQSVVAGTHAAIRAFAARMDEQGIGCRPVTTSHAFHSEMMVPIMGPFLEQLGRIRLHAPQLPYISNVSGDWITADEATDPAYWARHLRQPVRFALGLQRLLARAEDIVVEVGPGRTLSTLARRQAADRVVVASMRHSQDQQSDVACALGTASRLWLAGVDIDWSARGQRRRLPLPGYPFERQRYWITPAARALPSNETAAADTTRAPVAAWSYQPVWRQAGAGVRAGDSGDLAPRTWLLLADAAGVGAALAERLRAQGQSAIIVTPGATFERTAPHAYTLDPRRRADYQQLLRDLQAQAGLPQIVVHLWNLGPATAAWDDPAPVSLIHENGFYSLLYLAQALGSYGGEAAARLVVVTSQVQHIAGERASCPAKATVLGLCKVIPQEYPAIACQSIDVTLPESGDWQTRRLIDQLLAESTGPLTHPVVAYRDGCRWVQAYERLALGEPSPLPVRLRQQGVYLITGGLGGIGRALAGYLARTVQARLVLVNRTALPERERWRNWLAEHAEHDPVSARIRAVQALEAAGAEVLVAAADVADRAAMAAVVSQALARFGAIHGVVHSAGFVRDKLFSAIHDTDRETCEAHFHAKVYGLYALEYALRDLELDFCLLQSSLASILGGLGFAAYAAANSFMDAFAQAHNRAGPVMWTSMNWDAWQSPQDETAILPAHVAQNAIQPSEGVQVFERVLASAPAAQIIVSTSDLQTRINQWIERDFAPGRRQGRQTSVESLRARPDLHNDYVAPSTDIERQIVDIWQDILGVQVGVHDNFFELGGDSLMGVQVISRVQSKFSANINVASLYEGPTAHALAGIIERLGRARPMFEVNQARGERRRERSRIRRLQAETNQNAD